MRLLLCSLLSATAATASGCSMLLSATGAGASHGAGPGGHPIDDDKDHAAARAWVAEFLARPEAASSTPVALAPTRPAWCDGEHTGRDSLRRGVMLTGALPPTTGHVLDVARLACEAPDDASRQASVAIIRGGYLAYYGFTDADDQALLRMAYAGGDTTPCDVADQRVQMVSGRCRFGDKPSGGRAWDAMGTGLLDAVATVSEFAQVPRSELAMVAIGAPQQARISWPKVGPALVTAGVSPYHAASATYDARMFDLQLTETLRPMTATVAGDPGLQGVVAAAAEGAAAWDKYEASVRSVRGKLDEVTGAVAGGDKVALRACPAAMRSILSERLRGAASDDDLRQRAADPATRATLETMAMCHIEVKGNRTNAVSAFLDDLGSPNHTDRHHAALLAMYAELVTLGQQHQRYEDLADALAVRPSQVRSTSLSFKSSVETPIEVTEQAGGLRLRFKQTTKRKKVELCTEKPIIGYVCHWDFRDVTEGHSPVTVEAAQALEVKVGRAMRLWVSPMNEATVVAVYDRRGTRPLTFFGAPL